MIKVKENKATFEGKLTVLQAEFTGLIRSFEELLTENGFTKEEAQKEIDDSVKLARMSSDELRERFKDELTKILEEVLGD